MFLKKREKIEQRDRIIAYKNVFGTQDGKTVLYDLMNRFHVLHTHKGDPFQEGQRSAVLFMLGECSISIKALDELIKGESAE